MTVIQFKDARREREMRIIYIADAVSEYLVGGEFPDNPQGFIESETEDDLFEFHEAVQQILDGSWITEVLGDNNVSKHIWNKYLDALARRRAYACKEFEYFRREDGTYFEGFRLEQRAGDDLYHDEALASAREYLVSIADKFGIPALREAARHG